MNNIRLPHSVIVISPGLLPMLYTVPELSKILKIHQRTLRDWIKFRNVPHNRDKSSRIWINGKSFAEWVVNLRKPPTPTRPLLADGEGYCLTCRCGVPLQNTIIKPIKGTLKIIQGYCPHCGRKVCRGVRRDDTPDPKEVANGISQ